MMQKRKTRSKLLSFLLTLAMVIGFMPGMTLTAHAASLTGTSTTWSENCVVTEDVTIDDVVKVSGNITLTVTEGNTLTVNGGIDATEYTLTVSGKGTLKSFVFTGILNARLELEDKGVKYVCGEVQLEEGPSINAIILGISKKKGREIEPKLPLPVKPVFFDMGRYTTLFFELDEEN